MGGTAHGSSGSAAVDAVVASWSAQRSVFLEHRVFPARDPKTAPVPALLHPTLRAALAARGVRELWTHQARAIEALAAGRDVVVATPTASGKSLCYQAPVFDALVRAPGARALYLFPTKALSRDQVESARALAKELQALGAPTDLGVAVYDGDTPGDQRRAARQRARIVATNPDMLHTGILPHHAQWAAFFAGLTHVVVDELHVYRGWFGSGVANVLRRLRRICAFHGSSPRFVATSATIANPGELASFVLGSPRENLEEITDSGAPEAEREFFLYNPPVIDAALGMRASYIKATRKITRDLAAAGVSTLVFARTRRAVEVLVRTLHDRADDDLPAAEVRGYRGGYLPNRRREVEKALFDGEARVVVATSALELGIDVGGLGAVVIAGWPGSRAAVWQRAGRAGRRGERAIVVLISSSEPMDQYVVSDPEYLFGQGAEHGRVDPDNLSVLVPHIKCAAFELPFAAGECFGPLSRAETAEVLRALVQRGTLHEAAAADLAEEGAPQFHWIGDSYPAHEVSLRGPDDENFVVIEEDYSALHGPKSHEVIAEVDRSDAAETLHPNAVYQIEGKTFHVDRLDWENHRAYVKRVDIDHYTQAISQTKIRELEQLDSAPAAALGEIHLASTVVGFKKIKFHTHENVGYGEVALPKLEMHTRALTLLVDCSRVQRAVGGASHELCSGEGGRAGPPLIDGALGAAYALHHVSALAVMCDAHDLGRAVGDDACEWFASAGRGRGPFSTPELPAPSAEGARLKIFLYDNLPGGMGYANRLFDLRRDLVARGRKLIAGCGCAFGCPACVGPVGEIGLAGKEMAIEILARLREALDKTELRVVK